MLQALSDANFAIHLNLTQVCGWLLRGLFKKIKVETMCTFSKGILLYDLVHSQHLTPHPPPPPPRSSAFRYINELKEKLKCPKMDFAK